MSTVIDVSENDRYSDTARFKVMNVSASNVITDYGKVIKDIDGVVIRVGYRSYLASGILLTDSLLSTHYRNFKGKTKIGFYWNSEAITKQEAREEAEYIDQVLKENNVTTIDLPIYINGKYATSTKSGRADQLNSLDRTNIYEELGEALNKLGYQVGVFGVTNWLTYNLYLDVLRSNNFSIWISNVSETEKPLGIEYDAWNYTNTAIVDGYDGRATLSYFYKDLANWITKIDINTLNPILETDQYIWQEGGIYEPTVIFDDPNIVENTNYVLTYLDNKNVGTGRVIVTGIGFYYTGEKVLEFNIGSADINSFNVMIDYFDNNYTGNPIEPPVIITGLVEGKDYTISYENNINAGRAFVLVHGIGSFVGIKRVPFTIEPISLEDKEITIDPLYVIYTGEETSPTVTVENLKKDVDYTVTYSNNTKIGTAAVTVTGINNYYGTISGTYQIRNNELSGYKYSLSQDTAYYTGNEFKPTMNIEGLTQDIDYSVEYTDNINAGKGTVIATGMGDYEGTITASFTILPLDITSYNFKLATYSYIFNGYEITPEVLVDWLTKDKDYTVSYSNNIIVGKATITITGINNYINAKEITFSITARSIKTCQFRYGQLTTSGYYLKGLFRAYYPPYELKPEIDYTITRQDTIWNADDNCYDLTFYIRALGNFTGGEVTYSVKMVEEGEVVEEPDPEPRPDPPDDPEIPDYPDDGTYNFGDIDEGDETATKGYDFEDLDEGIDEESVANGDYDFNKLCIDSPSEFYEGDEIDLPESVGFYSSPFCKAQFVERSGLFYVYEPNIINNRIRLCSISDAVASPVRKTGWVNVEDIKMNGKLKVGDRVIVNGNIFKYTTGTGGYKICNDEEMYIVEMSDPAQYQYCYGLASAMNTRRLGWAENRILVRVSDDATEDE